MEGPEDPLVGVNCGDTSVGLAGRTLEGTPFTGNAPLVTVGCR
ncbi:MAG TPA: hypothetical protein VLI67_02000 [Vicinamibacteria bacterium]|nr:hypothetical protein [Vicinamibacteria bacterium]